MECIKLGAEARDHRGRNRSLQEIPSMSRTICLLLVVVSTACGGGCTQPPSISDEIKDAYRHYCDAVVKRDSAQAGALVAEVTLRRYQEYRDAALTSDEAALASETPTTRLQVLLLRQRMDAATLAALDGRGLFEHFIDQGWLDAAGFTETQLGMIAVDGDRAQAPVHRSGRPTRERAYFLWENGAWKVNLLPNFTGTDRNIEEAAAVNQKSEKAYLESLVAEVTKQPLRENIWQPLQ
jgi:hypothetical protein